MPARRYNAALLCLLLGPALALGADAVRSDESAAAAAPAQVRIGHEEQSLNGYRLGSYPEPGSRGAAYAKPTMLMEVTEATRGYRVSEHFTLGQFLCKQDAGWPRYLIVREPLLALLEAVVAELARRGQPVRTLAILSAYRTPAYNRSLGNVAHSRHIYGDAADIYVDEDSDGRMDDLDGNGRVELADALWLRDLVAGLAATASAGAQNGVELAAGGLAAYPENSAHGPFVHLDARGFVARWGP